MQLASPLPNSMLLRGGAALAGYAGLGALRLLPVGNPDEALQSALLPIVGAFTLTTTTLTIGALSVDPQTDLRGVAAAVWRAVELGGRAALGVVPALLFFGSSDDPRLFALLHDLAIGGVGLLVLAGARSRLRAVLGPRHSALLFAWSLLTVAIGGLLLAKGA